MYNEEKTKPLQQPPVGSSACPTCNGDGWYADHASSDLHDENGQCCGYCPVQVQCEDCKATGFVTNEQLKETQKYIERKKLQQKI